MEVSEIKIFLINRQGYLKEGGKRLRRVLLNKGFITTVADCKRAIREVNTQLKEASINKTPLKILIYDIETSLVEAQLWGSGKQYVGHDAITTETEIITVAWKWLGENEVYHLKWKDNNDKHLVKKFLEEYNKSDMVIGWNNNSFDNKILHARAMKYNYEVNTLVKSFDIMRQVKRVFRLPSYSMAYVSRYLGLAGKLNYGGGIRMWKDIQWGPKVDAKIAMRTMIAYNIQDVALTEEIYYKLRKYLGNIIHAGVQQGQLGITCPNCGTHQIELHHSSTTPAGTIQRIMICKKDNVKFKITNSKYLNSI